jgi:protease-4
VGENDDAKALVVAVDSPGGSALASDVLWRELQVLRDRHKKKVVISMGNVAASGGYYISMAGDRVFALPFTVTGSIGVVSGKFNVAELYGKFGYKKATVQRGANADLFVEYQPLREEQKTLMAGNMDITYKQFVSRVAGNRKKTFDEVDALAQGRVYTGAVALKHGLVDEMGGFREALAWARKESGLPADAPAVEYPPQPSFFEALFGGGKKDAVEARTLAALPADARAALAQAAALERLSSEPVLYYEPLVISGNPR